MNLEEFLKEFDSLYETLRRKNLVAEEFGERAFSLKGMPLPWFSAQKDIALTFLGLIHGNEVAGLPVLIHFMRLIANGNLQIPISLAFALGNIPAALKNERFLEKDLNRGFGMTDRSTYEDQRARILEIPLSRSAFVLDLHQTIEKTETPFFIFGADQRSLRLAHLLAPEIPIITYSISERIENGLVATGYAIQNGGVAVTLELGQKGFEAGQIQLGQQVASNLISLLVQTFNQHPLAPSTGYEIQKLENGGEDFEVYTFQHRFPNEGDSSELHAGFFNFCPVSKGQEIGTSSLGPLKAPTDGYLLFPKYGPAKRGSKELCVLLQKRPVSSFDSRPSAH